MTSTSPDLEDAALMRCSHCRKESNNQRVCPYCFMPYGDADPRTAERTAERPAARPTEKTGARPAPRPSESATPRATTATPRATTATARRATGDLPPVGADAAMDRALSGLSMEEVLPSASDAAPGALGKAWRWYRSQTPIVRRLLPVVVLLSLVGLIPMDSGDEMGPGVTVPKAAPDARAQAESLLAQTANRATIEQSGEELVVTYAITGFPTSVAEQKRLAEAFARADALVRGRRRTIYFYNPQGQVFAKSDSVVGVVLRQ